ncbi:MAG TPA: hypothetical protein VF384_09990 [Planctomycetota bacterium]
MRAFVLAALLALPSSRPDVLPPGRNPVLHELQLTWNGLPEWRFLAAPTRGLRGCTEIAPGTPFPFSTKYLTRLYAVPAGARVPADAELLHSSDWPRADIPVDQVWSVPSGHPLHHVITSLHVRGVQGRSVDLQVLGEQRFGPFGLPLGSTPWLPLPVVATIGVLLLRRCRARGDGAPA